MPPTFPSSTARLLLVLSLGFLLLANAHQLTPSPPQKAAPTPVPRSKATAGISPALVSTLRETLDAVKDVVSVISAFPIGGILGGGDLRLSSAVADCLDLLDLSADELSWSMSAISPDSRPTSAESSGRVVGTGDAHSDLQSWLSGALGNQDTCKEGLDDTGSALGSLVSTGLQAVTSLLADGLGQVVTGETSFRSSTGDRRGLAQGEQGVPHWLGRRERRLLQMPVGPGGMLVDAVVAKDGSGNYTTVRAALDAAPSESARRHVIYVKKGVYKETVEVKKKKWNVMMVGDGMGATVISGRLNYVDGYSTFRTATVGECTIHRIDPKIPALSRSAS